MDLRNFHNVYFIGIGGIGMSALAQYFADRDCTVSGYDRTRSSITDQLEQSGIAIHFEEDPGQLDHEADLVVYTPAIPSGHAELIYYRQNGYVVRKRSEVLGEITDTMTTVAVAGSHGKTTVSAMISHMLKECGVDCNAFIGGIMTNYNSNYLKGEDDVAVVEADEYDRSFLKLRPDIAVVTAIDTDHLDVYGSQDEVKKAFENFLANVKEGGTSILNAHAEVEHPKRDACHTYSLKLHPADYAGENLSVEEGQYVFDVAMPNARVEQAELRIGGRHNVENAIAAFAVADQMGVNGEKAKQALCAFEGVKRRFEYRLRQDDVIFIDDYAHHPEEIRVLLESVRELHPGKKVTVVFQPHLYSRTRDLADGLADQLSAADELILLEVYPAREQPIEGVTSQLIVDKAKVENKALMSRNELLEHVREHDFEVFLTVGAGDIDRLVEPVQEILENK